MNSKPSNPTQPSNPTTTTVPGETAKLSDGWYYIKNLNANKYLQVTGNTAKAGTNVELRTGNGAEGQKWYLKNVADGYVTLTSALGEFMVDVANAKNEDGANIQIYNGYSGNSQQFMLKKTSTNGAYILATKCSNLTKVLDDYNFGKEDGTNVCQWSYGGKANQQWSFEPVKANTETKPATTTARQAVRLQEGWYKIKNVNAQKYLQIKDNVAANCQNVELRTGDNSDGQKWYLKNLNDGTVVLTSRLGEFALDLYQGENEDGTNIEIYKTTLKDPQRFAIQTSSVEGRYIIATKSSNFTKVLDDYNFGKEDGTNVCQWSYGGKANQQWIFEPTNGDSQSNATVKEETKPEPKTEVKPETKPEITPAVTTGLKLDYTVNKWDGGYQVGFKITNNTSKAVNTWTLKIKKSEMKITSSWNVTLNEVGDYYVITPVSWNANIAKGGSVEFGIQGSGSMPNTLNYTLN